MRARAILYVDMDDTLVDFSSGVERLDEAVRRAYEGRLDEVPGIYAMMAPMPDAIVSFRHLAARFDTYVLSTAAWENPTAWSDKLLWVKAYLGDLAHKRLILSHHKNLNAGDYLIDDSTAHGAADFEGERIVFGSAEFPDWPTVVAYLDRRLRIEEKKA